MGRKKGTKTNHYTKEFKMKVINEALEIGINKKGINYIVNA